MPERMFTFTTISTITRVGLGAALLSFVVLGLVSLSVDRTFFEPINASVHAFQPPAAPVHVGFDLAHTAFGLIIHLVSSFFWGALATFAFTALRRPSAATAWITGLLTAAIAGVIDFGLLPSRLTPGWELALPFWGVALGLLAFGSGIALGLRSAVR